MGTKVMLYWFAALLPTPDPDEQTYYEILGVSPSAKEDQIRKAFRKKSLRLHPDKILQRGENPNDYRAEYQLVQEAHTVLSDKSKRSMYNTVGQSVKRYQFVQGGAMANPAGLLENLAASPPDRKCRLVLLLAIVVAAVLVQPVLVAAKVNQLLRGRGALFNVDWIVLLLPLWALHGLYVLVWLVVAAITGFEPSVTVAVLEQIAWLVGEILLALRWDRTVTWNYVAVFIPIYIALVLRWIQRLLVVRRAVNDVGRMVTQEQLEEQLSKVYEDCTEEEREELEKEFIVIDLPPEAMEIMAEQDDDFNPIYLSEEYVTTMEASYRATTSLVVGFFTSLPFVVLLVLKIDGDLDDTSWWIIFIPWWISLGFRILSNFYRCCCGTVTGDEVVLDMNDETGGDNDEEGIGGGGGGAKKDSNENIDLSTPQMFVHGNDDMRDFNAPISKDGNGDGSDEADKEEQKEESDVEKGNGTDSKNEPSTDNNTDNGDASAVPTQAGKSLTVDTGLNNDDTVMEETTETPRPPTDDESYGTYQHAYEQAETQAMEAQMRAQMDVCAQLFQLMMLCLIVGKLEDSFPTAGGGYNAVWILFPVFVLSGVLLCSCACLVFGAGQAGLDNLVERVNTADDTNENYDDEEAQASPAPPTTNVATTTDAPPTAPNNPNTPSAAEVEDLD